MRGNRDREGRMEKGKGRSEGREAEWWGKGRWRNRIKKSESAIDWPSFPMQAWLP